MPCAVDSSYEDQKELQLVTRAACDMAYVLKAIGKLGHLNDETLEWIRKHDQEDERRRYRERSEEWMEEHRKRLLAQMSPQDRRVLGLE